MSLSRVEKVLNAAKVLEVSIAVDACVQYLIESLTPVRNAFISTLAGMLGSNTHF